MEPTPREFDDQISFQPVSKPQGSPASTNTTLNLGEYQKRLEPMTELSPGEKLVLIKVQKLSNDRVCESTNRQIAEYVGIPFRTITRIIPDLINKGYLNVNFPKSKNRVLYCSSKID